MSETAKVMDLDEALVKELGQFGRFQMYNLLLMAVPLMMSSTFGEFVFTAADVHHRCRIPECEDRDTTEFKPPWISDAVPTGNPKLSSCFRYAPLTTANSHQRQQCSAMLFDKSTVVPCDSYVYDRNNTIVYDFDIGCSEWLRSVPGTLNGIGCLLALPVTGYFSDRFGRRLALIVSLLNTGIFGVLRAFSVNFSMFAVLEILQTTMGSGVFSTGYIMAAEFTGPKYRVTVGTISAMLFSVGSILLGCFAYLIQPWRYLTLFLFLPCFLVAPLYYYVLTESVRWLLSKQKYSEAKIVLEKVARVNKKEISNDTMMALMNPHKDSEKGVVSQNDDHRSLVSVIVKSPILLRRICTVPVWWMATVLNFYGLTINSISFTESMYLNYILVAMVEIPGFLFGWLVMDRIGRKPVMAGGFFLCAICNFLYIFVPTEMPGLRLGVAMVAKFGISVVFNGLYLFTSELYPTKHRHTLLGFSSMIGRIGNVLSPLTPALSQYWSGAPLTLFGIMSLIAGLLTLTQPETLGTRLPDTLQEAEDLGRTIKELS